MHDEAILRAEGLRVAYGAAVAVSDVSLTLKPRQIVGVFGPNGAGKSSLLKAIVGLVRPLAGRVLLAGQEVTRYGAEARARRGVILVPEGRGIFGPLTVEENLRLGLYPAKFLDKHEVEERLSEAFELFPTLKERRAQVAGTLSGGEAAMLAVARGLMSRPRVLLLDEPSLGLAPGITLRLFERLGHLRQTNMGMVIVEQRAAELMDLVDYSLVMRQGRQEHWGEGGIGLAEFNRMYFGS